MEEKQIIIIVAIGLFLLIMLIIILGIIFWNKNKNSPPPSQKAAGGKVNALSKIPPIQHSQPKNFTKKSIKSFIPLGNAQNKPVLKKDLVIKEDPVNIKSSLANESKENSSNKNIDKKEVSIKIPSKPKVNHIEKSLTQEEKDFIPLIEDYTNKRNKKIEDPEEVSDPTPELDKSEETDDFFDIPLVNNTPLHNKEYAKECSARDPNYIHKRIRLRAGKNKREEPKKNKRSRGLEAIKRYVGKIIKNGGK